MVLPSALKQMSIKSLEFFIDIKSFRSHYGPGVDSASNRNEYREYFLGGKGGRCVRLTTLPLLFDDYLEINLLEPSRPVRVLALPLLIKI